MTSSRGIDEALTRRVADLARLELTDEEVKTFTRQIGDILGYVEQLQKVGVSDTTPLLHPHDESEAQAFPASLREDVVVEFPPDPEGRPRTLSAAPEVVPEGAGGGFKVPQII